MINTFMSSGLFFIIVFLAAMNFSRFSVALDRSGY